MKESSKQIIIGRSDKADFPEFDLRRINVKVDSGAYTSAIHCCKITLSAKGELEIIFLDEDDPNFTGKVHKFKEFIKKRVRSSNGAAEERYIISTKIKFHEYLYDINLSVTFRGDMRFPVLLGRRFLTRNHFIINPRLKDSLHKKTLDNSDYKL